MKDIFKKVEESTKIGIEINDIRVMNGSNFERDFTLIKTIGVGRLLFLFCRRSFKSMGSS